MRCGLSGRCAPAIPGGRSPWSDTPWAVARRSTWPTSRTSGCSSACRPGSRPATPCPRGPTSAPSSSMATATRSVPYGPLGRPWRGCAPRAGPRR
ncbi:hypothetical protein N864_10425 [Intrasporangium chromatireducens Q5-1]|uniref:Uncharacterized protein n=1 Tax=Intrasporangium chromatireducens Q5-1 TaxID=584657 RepID=W9GLN1_9MICO|nr:hypothetical protein N864_10425 [Intrasporangium chromatireducens Q5-1]